MRAAANVDALPASHALLTQRQAAITSSTPAAPTPVDALPEARSGGSKDKGLPYH